MSVIRPKIERSLFQELLSAYERWNSEEDDADRDKSEKAHVLSTAILRCSELDFWPDLRELFTRIRLSGARSSREIVLGLLRTGDQQDVRNILDRIANEEDRINFYNHAGLCHAVVLRMSELGEPLPEYLKEMINKREFFQYIGSTHRTGESPDLLPLANTANRALYIRLTSHAAIGAGTTDDAPLLIKLVNHEYGLTSRAAALKLVHLFGPERITILATGIRDALASGVTEPLANALRFAEIEIFGLSKLD